MIAPASLANLLIWSALVRRQEVSSLKSAWVDGKKGLRAPHTGVYILATFLKSCTYCYRKIKIKSIGIGIGFFSSVVLILVLGSKFPSWKYWYRFEWKKLVSPSTGPDVPICWRQFVVGTWNLLTRRARTMMWHMALSLVSGETVPWTEVNSWGNQSKSCHYLSFDVVKLRPRDMIIYT